MSSDDLKSVASVTGTYRRPPALAAGGNSINGNDKTMPGKKVPDAEQAKPDVEKLAKKLNVAIQSIGRDLRFEVNMDSGRSVIQVLDRETGEVIRQIPPEKASLYRSSDGAVALRLYDEQV